MMPLMHDDSTAILRSYTEEALAKSRKGNKGKNSRVPKAAKLKTDGEVQAENEPTTTQNIPSSLKDASEEELIRELARRRAERFRLAGAMPGRSSDDHDPTGQVCTLNGGNGSIPCRELME